MLAALVIGAKLVTSGVFVWASIAKLADLPGFRGSLQGFGIPRAVVGSLALLVPLIEMTVGLLVWMPAFSLVGAVAAVALLAIFTILLVVQLARGRRPVCHCFGQLSSRQIGWPDVVRNGGLLAVAGFVVSRGPIDAPGGAIPWLGAQPGLQLAFVGAGVIVLSMVGFNLSGFFRSRARLPAGSPSLDAEQMHSLPLGEAAADVELFDETGREVSAEVLRRHDRRPTVIVFLGHGCPTCATMKPVLAEWQRQYAPKAALAVVLPWKNPSQPTRIDAGEPAIVFQRARAATTAFRAFVIPCAVRIDAAGRIDSPLVVGENAVRTLVLQTVGASEAPPGGGDGELARKAAG